MHPILFLAALAVTATHTVRAKEPCSSREVRAEIAEIRQKWNIDNDPTLEHVRAALWALGEKYPDDVEARLAFFYGGSLGQDARDASLAEARKLHEANPDSPALTYIWARQLPPADAAPVARSLAEKHPEFPWGHLLEAEAESNKVAAADEAVIRKHLTRFRELCPDSLWPFRLAARTTDKAFLASSASSLRRILEKDASASNSWETLWTLEFEAASPGDYPAVREKVRKDVERLWPWLASDPSRTGIVLRGADLVEDPKLRARAEDEILRARPVSLDSLEILQRRFRKKEPQPSPGAPRADVIAFEHRLLTESKTWTSRFGDYPLAWLARLYADLELHDVPDEEAETAGEGLLAALRARPFDVSSPRWPFQDRVARLYLGRGIRMREVIELAEGAAPTEEGHMHLRAIGSKQDFAETLDVIRWLGRPIVIEAKARLGERAEARSLLNDMERELPSEPATSAPEEERIRWIDRHSLFEQARAGLALADGRTPEALVHYRTAVHLYPVNWRNLSVAAEAARRARILWQRQYGSLEGYDAWRASDVEVSTETAASWTELHRRLPDFALTATDGRIWKLADLKGKTTLVILWATWCGPCRAELRYVEHLYQRLKAKAEGEKGLRLLTLSLDENPGAVGPFLKEEGLTFPVLFAGQWVASTFGDLSIPRAWVVASDGILELESSGFTLAPIGKWEKRMEEAMDRVARGTAVR